MVICQKCKRDITEQWKLGVTYKGEEEHHNPPKFMIKNWNGELLNLCVECHDNLHKEIIKILNKCLGSLKFINNEYWAWVRMSLSQRDKAKQKTINFTKKWLEEDGDTNPR